MTPEQLHSIADRSAANLKRLFEEGGKEICQAASDCAEEAHLQGKDKITFKLSHTITLDLVKHAQTDALCFGVRRKLEVSNEIDDPAQLKMALD